MQFMVLAYDGTDEGALARRLKVREAHLAGVAEMKKRGEIVAGGAILDDDGTMIGSIALMNFPDRTALDRWIASDPYTTGDVWRTVEVRPVKLAL